MHGAVKVQTIRLVVADEAEEMYFRTVWHLIDALWIVGARNQVVPVLERLFEEAFAEWESHVSIARATGAARDL
jgi:hypothetical protein